MLEGEWRKAFMAGPLKKNFSAVSLTLLRKENHIWLKYINEITVKKKFTLLYSSYEKL